MLGPPSSAVGLRLTGRVSAKQPLGWGEPMRLEGWHVMVFLAMLLLLAAAVVVAVTFIVLWTVRLARKRKSGGPNLPPNQP